MPPKTFSLDKLYLLLKKALYSIIISGVLISFAGAQNAQQGVALRNPIQSNTVEELLLPIARYLAVIGVPLATLFIIISGFMFLTARGDVEKLKTAKKMLLWAIIGTVIIVGAAVFAQVTVNFARSL